MATNPEEIRLPDDYRQRLAKFVDQHGTSWQALLDTFMAHIEQQAITGEQPVSVALPSGIDEDTAYLALCMQELEELEAQQSGTKKPTIQDAWRILSKVPGSMVDDINDDRGDR